MRSSNLSLVLAEEPVRFQTLSDATEPAGAHIPDAWYRLLCFHIVARLKGRHFIQACESLAGIYAGQVQEAQMLTASMQAGSLLNKIAEISAAVPDDAWAAVPSDLAHNLDHYLYGTAKRE